MTQSMAMRMAPQRQSTTRKQASLARGQSDIQEEDLGNRGLRPGFSSLGRKTQSLAPFQVSCSLYPAAFPNIPSGNDLTRRRRLSHASADMR